MQNEKLVIKWVDSAQMDYLTAIHLYENMYPKPLEIIGYHAEQAVEKLLKAMLSSYGHKLLKTHDLGLLAETLQEFTEISEKDLEICERLTPFGVKFRYPQEIGLEEYHIISALKDMKIIYNDLLTKIRNEMELIKAGKIKIMTNNIYMELL